MLIGDQVRGFGNLDMQLRKVCNHPFLFYDNITFQDWLDESVTTTSATPVSTSLSTTSTQHKIESGPRIYSENSVNCSGGYDHINSHVSLFGDHVDSRGSIQQKEARYMNLLVRCVWFVYIQFV